jgi:YD repeat-containing protein
VVQRSDVAGVTSYSWTPRGQVAAMVDPLTNSTHTFSYSAAGDLLTDSITDGVSTLKRSYGRDGMGRVTSDSVTNGAGTAVASMTYAYDSDGNLVNRVTAGVGSETFAYDWAGRLASWTDPSGKVTGYGYDGAGNRVSTGGVVATFDERNRMLADGAGTVIGWSPAGTMSSRTVGAVSTLFAYDGLGRMTSAGSVTYTVDGFDRVVNRGGVSLSYSGAALQPTSDGTGTMSVLPDGTPVGSRSGTTGTVVVANKLPRLYHLML